MGRKYKVYAANWLRVLIANICWLELNKGPIYVQETTLTLFIEKGEGEKGGICPPTKGRFIYSNCIRYKIYTTKKPERRKLSVLTV